MRHPLYTRMYTQAALSRHVNDCVSVEALLTFHTALRTPLKVLLEDGIRAGILRTLEEKEVV